MSRLAVATFGMLSGVFCIILLQIGININWRVAWEAPCMRDPTT